jgi:hypothetical protein
MSRRADFVKISSSICALRSAQLGVAQQKMAEAKQALAHIKATQAVHVQLQQEAHTHWQAHTMRARFDPELATHWASHIWALESKAVLLREEVNAAIGTLAAKRLIAAHADGCLKAAQKLEQQHIKKWQGMCETQTQQRQEDRSIWQDFAA